MESAVSTTDAVKARTVMATPARKRTIAIVRSNHVFLPSTTPLHALMLKNSASAKKTTEKTFNELFAT